MTNDFSETRTADLASVGFEDSGVLMVNAQAPRPEEQSAPNLPNDGLDGAVLSVCAAAVMETVIAISVAIYFNIPIRFIINNEIKVLSTGFQKVRLSRNNC
jgi:hypothetical protein